jgi:DNA-binding NarL/FixJ family response regulator
MTAAAEPAGAVPLSAAQAAGIAPALRAYLVEDNRLVRENLIAALQEMAPLRVVGSAADERVAIDWLSDGVHAFDLMIIDLFLHSGSGLGVLAAARARWPQAALVVLSNFATEGVRARCLATGADRVFDKSRDIDQLVGYCAALAARGDARTH